MWILMRDMKKIRKLPEKNKKIAQRYQLETLDPAQQALDVRMMSY